MLHRIITRVSYGLPWFFSCLSAATPCQPRLALTDFSYSVRVPENAFEVDRYLELRLRRALDVVISPKRIACDDSDGVRFEEWGLRPGATLAVRIALALGSDAEPRWLSGIAREATIDEQGRLTVTVPLIDTLSDEIGVRTRFLLAAEVALADQRAAGGFARLDGVTYSRGQTVRFQPLSQSIRRSLAGFAGDARGELRAAAPLRSEALALVFPEKVRPKALHTDDLDDSSPSATESLLDADQRGPWQQALQNYEAVPPEQRRALIAGLCHKLTSQPAAAECRKEPERFFSVNVLELVEAVEAAPVARPTAQPNTLIQVAASFFHGTTSSDAWFRDGVTESHSTDAAELERTGTGDVGGTTRRNGFNVELEGGYQLLGNGATSRAFGGYEHFGGTQWLRGHESLRGYANRRMEYKTVESSHVSQLTSALTATSLGSLRVESYELELKVSLRACLLIRRLTAAPEAFLGCLKLPHRTRIENWYFISDSNPSSDPTHPESVWVRAMRGRGVFEAFRRSLEDSTRNYFFRPRPEAPTGAELAEWHVADRLALERGAYPSVLRVFPPSLSPRPASPKKWSLSEIAGANQKCVQATVLAGGSARRAQIYCSCIYDSLAERVAYAEYAATRSSVARWEQTLRQDKTEDKCVSLAKKR